MARLTYKKRKSLSKSSFAIKKGNKYPINDIAHARNALARVSTYGTPAQKRTVARAVKRKYPGLGKRSAFIKRTLGGGRKKR